MSESGFAQRVRALLEAEGWVLVDLGLENAAGYRHPEIPGRLFSIAQAVNAQILRDLGFYEIEVT